MKPLRTLRTVVAVSIPVAAATTLAILGLCAFRVCVPQDYLAESANAVGNYLQTLGTIYAVLLAFVVYVVWNQFNEARALVEREANEIIDLYRTALGLPEPARGYLQTALATYIEAVLEREWGAMARRDEATSEQVGKILDGVWSHLHTFDADRECHRVLFAEAMTRFNDLSDVRSARLTSARSRIPLAMSLLIYAGAFIVVASLYLIPVQRFTIHAALCGALAGSIAHVLYLVHDLDDAFAGDWRVSRDSFRRAHRYVKEHAAM